MLGYLLWGFCVSVSALVPRRCVSDLNERPSSDQLLVKCVDDHLMHLMYSFSSQFINTRRTKKYIGSIAKRLHRSNDSQSSAHLGPPPPINDINPRNLITASSGHPMYRTVFRLARNIQLPFTTTCCLHFRSHAMSTKPHVGVIGAGLAGLRCADILIQNGAQVTILEARDRLGGRVCLCHDLWASWMLLSCQYIWTG